MFGSARSRAVALLFVLLAVAGCGDSDGAGLSAPESASSAAHPAEPTPGTQLAEQEAKILAAGEELQQVVDGQYSVDAQLEAVVASLCTRMDDPYYLGVAEGFYQRMRLAGTRQWPVSIEQALEQQCV